MSLAPEFRSSEEVVRPPSSPIINCPTRSSCPSQGKNRERETSSASLCAMAQEGPLPVSHRPRGAGNLSITTSYPRLCQVLVVGGIMDAPPLSSGRSGVS